LPFIGSCCIHHGCGTLLRCQANEIRQLAEVATDQQPNSGPAIARGQSTQRDGWWIQQ
jgi:hypothetical protein